MEEKYSIGTILNLNRNVRENRKDFKIDVEDLSLLEYELLKIRTKIEEFNTVENVCKYQFVTEFSNHYRRCADPLRSHKNVMKTSFHKITLKEFRLYCITYEILPGQKLCFRCKNKEFVEKKENENVDTEHENDTDAMETDEILHETANDIVKQSLEMLECSSLKISRPDRTLSIGKRNIKDVTIKFKNVLFIVLLEPKLTENSDCSNYQRSVDSIKEKITHCSNKRKNKFLLLPQNIGQSKKTVEFFNVSGHPVKQARKLKKEKVILATLSNYYREGLDKETKKYLEFYDRDGVSR